MSGFEQEINLTPVNQGNRVSGRRIYGTLLATTAALGLGLGLTSRGGSIEGEAAGSSEPGFEVAGVECVNGDGQITINFNNLPSAEILQLNSTVNGNTLTDTGFELSSFSQVHSGLSDGTVSGISASIYADKNEDGVFADVELIGGGTDAGSYEVDCDVDTTPVTSTVPEEKVCEDLDSGKIDVEGDVKVITITADPGELITRYCVKAGSANQGLGPVYIDVEPPVASLEISHPSGKDISHYSFETEEVETTTTTAPAPSTTAPAPSTTAPAPSTTAPAPSTTVGGPVTR